ncbi:MAG: fused MFS/spermidine synthase [Acidobacteriota bacterium]
MKSRVQPVYVLFVVSGFCALVYETIWLRIFAIYCGNTTFAVTAVLTAFMAGLGIGSYLIGKLVDRSPQPLRVYALMEFLIAVYAWLLPHLTAQLKPSFGFLTNSLQNYFFPMNLGRFALVLVLLLFPTAMMGGTLPALVKALGGERGQTASRLAVLYAMNTLGGALGTGVAGFYMIGSLGLERTQRWAILINFAVAAGAYLMSRLSDYSSASVPPMQLAPPTRPPQNFLLVCFGLAGFAALAYEVVSLRLLLFLLPYGYNNVYVFSTVLVTFLFGIFAGSILVARYIESLRDPLRTAGVIQIALALSTGLSLPVLALLLKVAPAGEAVPEFSTRAFYSFLFSFLVLLPPTALMGAALPVYGRLGMANYARLGTDVGRIYAANTFGNIAGAFLGGFVLIPFLGLQKSFALILLVYMFVGVSLYGAAEPPGKQRRYKRYALAISLAAILVVLILPFSRLAEPEPPYKLLHYSEGISSTLMVLQQGPDCVLQINDFVAAGTDYEHLRNQRMMAYLPLLLHKDPRNALVICLGTGTTAGALALYPPMTRITVVEIDEQVPDALNYFSKANFSLRLSRKAKVVVEDGRAFMEFDPGRYDIITGEPLHPKRAGTVNLYTSEYYKHGLDHLADGGIFAQWLPDHALTRSEFCSIMKAFGDVFPHCYLWMGEQLVMLGTRQPLRPDFEQVVARSQMEEVRAGLYEIDFDDPIIVLCGFLAWDDNFRSYAAQARQLTDDLPWIEFSRDLENHNLIRDIFSRRASFLPMVNGLDASSEEFAAAYASQVRYGAAIAALLDGQLPAAIAGFEESLRLRPDRRAERWLRTARAMLAQSRSQAPALQGHP